MSYAALFWATLHTLWEILYPTELSCTLLSCAANCWTTLKCLSYCTLTMLPLFLQFFRCRTVWHPVSPVLEWKEMQMPEPVRYRNRETQAGTIPLTEWHFFPLFRYLACTVMTAASIAIVGLSFWAIKLKLSECLQNNLVFYTKKIWRDSFTQH